MPRATTVQFIGNKRKLLIIRDLMVRSWQFWGENYKRSLPPQGKEQP